MPTNAVTAAKLLRNAAEFFRSVGEQNSDLDEQMRANAETYDKVALWLEADPNGEGPSDEDTAINENGHGQSHGGAGPTTGG